MRSGSAQSTFVQNGYVSRAFEADVPVAYDSQHPRDGTGKLARSPIFDNQGICYSRDTLGKRFCKCG